MMTVTGCESSSYREDEIVRFGDATCSQRGAVAAWLVEAEPTRSIEIPESLYRVSAVFLDSESRLWVASGGANRLAIFDERGELVTSRGGTGEGPGEFGFLGAAAPFRGDSAIAFDVRLARVTVVDRLGRYGRVLSIARGPGGGAMLNPVLIGSDRTGRVVVEGRIFFFEGSSTRDSAVVAAFASDGSSARQLMRLPHTLSYGLEIGGRIERGNPPYSPQAAFAMVGPLLVGAVSDIPALRVVDVDSGRELQIELPCTLSAVEDRHVDAYISAQLQESPDPAFTRQRLNAVPFAPTVPMWGKMIGDPAGYVWFGASSFVQEHHGHATTTDWLVADVEDGRIVARVRTPPGLVVTSIQGKSIAGVRYDEHGLESVQVYQLRRSGDSRADTP